MRLGPISHIVCLGAHADDIEIGAAGTLLRLAAEYPDARFQFVVLSASPERAKEAIQSAKDLLGDRAAISVGEFRDGFLPYGEAALAKDWTRAQLGPTPDLAFAPTLTDHHQDHRFVSELAWQLFRRVPILEYEIPKWEGDRPACNVLVPLDADTMSAKLTHLMDHFNSQHEHTWYRPEVFEGSACLRGLEAGATFAEGFVARKLVWSAGP